MTATSRRVDSSRRGLLVDSAMAAVAYSDLFDQPLTVDEIHRYLSLAAERSELEEALLVATDAGLLARTDALLSLPHRRATVEIRRVREAASADLLDRAMPWLGRIARLPTVRMVALTGSLAVGNVERDADVDLLIVTRDGRLWITRALVMAIARAARRAGVELCPNFLIAESKLALDDRDLIAARELVQSVLVSGPEVYADLIASNRWYRQYLPNARPGGDPLFDSNDHGPVMDVTGWLLDRRIVDRIERFELERVRRQLGTDLLGDEVLVDESTCKAHVDGHKRRIADAYRRALDDVAIESGGPTGEVRR